MLASGSVVCCTAVCRGLSGQANPTEPHQDPINSTAEGFWYSAIHPQQKPPALTWQSPFGVCTWSPACIPLVVAWVTASHGDTQNCTLYCTVMPACVSQTFGHAVCTVPCRGQRQETLLKQHAAHSCGWQDTALSLPCQSSSAIHGEYTCKDTCHLS